MSERKCLCLLTLTPESSHPQKISKGVFAQCRKYGYNVAQFASMISLDFYYKDYKAGEENIYELPDLSRFDGVILDTVSLMNGNYGAMAEHIYERLSQYPDTPVVSIGIPLHDFDTVTNFNEEQVRGITRHAVEVHGCRDICVLTGFKGNHEAEERLEIILDELGRHGISVSGEHIVYGDFWYPSGEQLARDIFEGRISKPDCIISTSDHMGLGFIEEYTKLGGRVPEDICVMAFDATPEGMLNNISLTSIESNYAKCAADAVDRLRAIIDPGAEILPYEPDVSQMLHIGMSCGCQPDVKKTFETIKSSLYFITRNYTIDIFNDNIDIGLLMENYIPEQLAAAKDPEELIELIHNMAYIIQPHLAFYLCLRDDWLDISGDFTKGYPEKMRLAVLRSNIGEEDISGGRDSYLFDTSLMLPQLFDDYEEPSAFYFTAVHFSDKALGYAVLRRKLTESNKFNLVYRNWLRFVNTALEMARTKHRFVTLSNHDKMTGLLNRRGMSEELGRLKGELGGDKELFV